MRAKLFSALAMLSTCLTVAFLTKQIFGLDWVFLGCVVGTFAGFLAAALTCRNLTNQLIVPDN